MRLYDGLFAGMWIFAIFFTDIMKALQRLLACTGTRVPEAVLILLQ